MIRWVILSLFTLWISGCQMETGHIPPGSRILMMGDSALAWNKGQGASVGDALARELGEPVVNRSRSGAKISSVALSSFDIRAQYVPGPWQWIVMNGGANDLAFECGCGACQTTLNRLISPDGSVGEIPEFVAQIRFTGAHVVWMGYINPPQTGNLFSGCRRDVLELQARVARMAARNPRVTFVRMRDAFPNTDHRFYALDQIHPSPLGSAALARKLARAMREAK
jgi:lysophospholipase L1-like esterase